MKFKHWSKTAYFVAICAIVGCTAHSGTKKIDSFDRDVSEAKILHDKATISVKPFARLYGEVKACWLDRHTAKSFNTSTGSLQYAPWVVERSGFVGLDEENQRLYLVIRMASVQPEDAEKSEQFAALITLYKTKHTSNLRDYMLSLNHQSLSDFCLYLESTPKRFNQNISIFLGQSGSIINEQPRGQKEPRTIQR